MNALALAVAYATLADLSSKLGTREGERALAFPFQYGRSVRIGGLEATLIDSGRLKVSRTEGREGGLDSHFAVNVYDDGEHFGPLRSQFEAVYAAATRDAGIGRAAA